MLSQPHQRLTCFALLVVLGVASLAMVGGRVLWSQDTDPAPPAVAAPAEEPAAEPADDASTNGEPAVNERADSPPDRVVIQEPAAKKSAFEQVDGGFATVVGWMETVLFYRLGSYSEQYVQYDDVVQYVRPRGSHGPFNPVGAAFQGKESLTNEEVEALVARGKIVMGQQGATRLGVLNGKTVESITISIDRNSKYIGRRDKQGELHFHKQLPMREMLSEKPEEILSRDQVRTLAAQGKLKLNDQQVDSAILQALHRKSEALTAQELSEELETALTVVQVRLLDLETRKFLKEAGGWFDLTESGESRAERLGDQIATPFLLKKSTGGAPIVVLWLALGSVLFTLYMRGVNFWAFSHAVSVVMGKYDDPNEPGEVTHFQALSSALSATVGLGNIAGVTIAMVIGGPGAFFWMLVCGLFGMTSKFVECTLGQKFRTVKEDGTILGGPMQYLQEGLKGLGFGTLGTVLSLVFAVMCILASFGGGNMFQSNQATSSVVAMLQQADQSQVSELNDKIKAAAAAEEFNQLAVLQSQRTTLLEKMEQFSVWFSAVFGLVFAVCVAAVILGGIKRIAAAASKVVPTMCLLYILACLFIILKHIGQVPPMIGLIFTEAFTGNAIGGGIIGVIVVGVQRAAFSNEAGVGSAAIAHSAAKTDEPVREGTVALLGPFIDTIVVCSMTALVILITNAWQNSEWVVEQGLEGAALTSKAFESEISWFPYVLTVAVVLFAYSTVISWSYYGERCWERLFGAKSTIVYKIIYVVAVFIGAIVNLGAVLVFSDMMILSMAFPNILGALMLAPQVRRDLLDYWERYQAGKFKTFK